MPGDHRRRCHRYDRTDEAAVMNLLHEGPSDGSLAGGARYEVKRKEERKLSTFYDFFQGLLEALWGYPRREIPPNIASTVEVISIPRSPTGGVPRPGPAVRICSKGRLRSAKCHGAELLRERLILVFSVQIYCKHCACHHHGGGISALLSPSYAQHRKKRLWHMLCQKWMAARHF